MTIASHTELTAGAFVEIEIRKNDRVAPNAFIWAHAQNEKDADAHLRATEMCAWISFDSLKSDAIKACLFFFDRCSISVEEFDNFWEKGIQIWICGAMALVITQEV